MSMKIISSTYFSCVAMAKTEGESAYFITHAAAPNRFSEEAESSAA